jgi:multiple sugar transport system permease protein
MTTTIDKFSKRENIAALLFLLPYSIVFLLFRVYPIVSGFLVSLYKRDILGLENDFIALGNYVNIFQDSVFWRSLWNTFRFTLMVTPTMIPLALFLAILLIKPMLGSRLYRLILFAPRVLSVSVVALICLWIWQPEWGVLNFYFQKAGIPSQKWLSDSTFSMVVIVLIDLWWVVGYYMVIFMAGLRQIPEELYEAASIDGASRWQSFWNITIPGLRGSLMFVMITHVIGAFQIFGLVNIITGGGPYDSTKVLVQYIYLNGFSYYKMGYASALAYVLMLIILFFTLVQFKVLNRQD